MSRPQLDEILSRIQGLQEQLEQEFSRLLAEKRTQFKYSLEKGRIIFDEGVRELQRRYRTSIWSYLREAEIGHVLTAPIIYSVVFPLLFLDLAVTLYQHICFRVYGIALVKRADYMVFDHRHLSYLNIIEKFNCLYCSYGNGLAEYVREVISRTEQYWCPIKHARSRPVYNQRAEHFSEYGDAEGYRTKLQHFRDELGDR